MKVKEMYPSFTGLIDVGQYALFIVLDEYGVEYSQEELINRIAPFNNVVLLGKNTYAQRDEMAPLIKKCINKNNTIVFHVHTDGVTRPISMGGFEHVKYYITPKMKRDGGKYEDRIIPRNMSWFIKILGKFIFQVSNEDDVDEVSMIATDMGIPKNQIYLTSTSTTNQDEYDTIDFIIKQAKHFGYNIAPKVCIVMWPDEGKIQEDGIDE